MNDIEKMTPQQKSVLLARAMGCPAWITLPPGEWTEYNQFFNLYEVDSKGNPIHMPLAWRALQYFKNEGGNLKDTDYYEWLYFDDPAEALRFWLDKILAIGLDAGQIKLGAS